MWIRYIPFKKPAENSTSSLVIIQEGVGREEEGKGREEEWRGEGGRRRGKERCREGEAKGFTGRDWERNRVVNG